MDWGWKYHLDCYLEQKKNSSKFLMKDSLNCFKIVWNKKKLNPTFSSIFTTSHLMLENFSRPTFLAKYNAFSLINTPLTGTFLDLSLLKHLSTSFLSFHPFHRSTALLKSLRDLIFIFFHVGSVFARTPNNCAISLLVLPFSSSNKALYLSSRICPLWNLFAIFPYTRETYSRA